MPMTPMRTATGFSSRTRSGPTTAPKRDERAPMRTNVDISPATIANGRSRCSPGWPAMTIGSTGRTHGETMLARPAPTAKAALARLNPASESTPAPPPQRLDLSRMPERMVSADWMPGE